MRRVLIPLLVLAAVLGGTMLAGADDINEELSCEAEQGLTVDGLADPSCTITFVCPFDTFACFWAYDLSVNGLGAVAGTMTIEQAAAGEANWLAFGPGVREAPPPQCAGLFSCNSHTVGPPAPTVVLAATPGTVITIRCSGGGVAAVEQVDCRLDRVVGVGGGGAIITG